MTGSRLQTCAQSRVERIAALNDKLRTTGVGGQLMLTAGIRALPETQIGALLHAMRLQRDFSGHDDPYGEHDMGTVRLGEHKAFWKIDYYDPDLAYGSPDPADPTVTRRVLTLMLASEY